MALVDKRPVTREGGRFEPPAGWEVVSARVEDARVGWLCRLDHTGLWWPIAAVMRGGSAGAQIRVWVERGDTADVLFATVGTKRRFAMPGCQQGA